MPEQQFLQAALHTLGLLKDIFALLPNSLLRSTADAVLQLAGRGALPMLRLQCYHALEALVQAQTESNAYEEPIFSFVNN